MSQNWVILLQSALITLQAINASLETLHVPAAISVVVSAVIGGAQFYVTHVAYQSTPPSK